MASNDRGGEEERRKEGKLCLITKLFLECYLYMCMKVVAMCVYTFILIDLHIPL